MNLDITLKIIFALKWPMTQYLEQLEGFDVVQLKPTMRYIPERQLNGLG